MKKIYSFLLFILTIALANAQTTERAVVTFEPGQLNQAELWLKNGQRSYKASALADVPLEAADPFIAYSIVWYTNSWEESDQLLAIFSNGTTQTEPVKIVRDAHAMPAEGKYVSQLYFTEKDQKKIRLHYAGHSKIERVEVHFFDPGKSLEMMEPSTTVADRSACPCPLPDLVQRSSWCPTGNCPPDPTPVPTTVTHLIIHHSAGSNSSSDWAAVVRAIWDFHVNVNGWDDIGYNYLVDPNGVLYEGRGNNWLGAHFCGTNGGTMGVCIMGDFTSIQPTANALGMLTELFSWKACDVNIDPLGNGFHASSGMDLMYVSGHRDGCATACPGNSFYPLLPSVRDAIQDRIDNVCSGVMIAAPGNLNAIAVSNDAIEITWEDLSDNEESFVLERSVSFNNNYTVLTTLPANTIGYDDFDVLPSTGYFYRVKAVQGTLSSTYSNEDFAATNLAASGSRHLNESTVVIAPNPIADQAVVFIDNQLSGNITYSLFDVSGKQLRPTVTLEKPGEKINFKMAMTSLPAGVYWLKISQGDETGMFRLLKL